MGIATGWRWRMVVAVLGALAVAGPAGAIDIVGRTSVRLEWAPSTGSNIFYYYVYVEKDGGPFTLSQIQLMDSPFTVLQGEYGHEYRVRVQAVANTGEFTLHSEPSPVIRFVAAETPPPPADDPPADDPPADDPPADDPPAEDPPADDPPADDPPADDPPADDPPADDPPAEDPPGDPIPAALLDFNGDGLGDLLLHDPRSGAVEAWFVEGGRVLDAVRSDPIGSTTRAVGTGDYDADGYADFMGFDEAQREIDMRLLVAGRVVESARHRVSQGFRAVASADFDGDGHADVLCYKPPPNKAQIWSFQGTELLGITDITNTPDGAEVAGVGDYNGDGVNDILWQTTRSLIVWTLGPGGKLGETTVVPWMSQGTEVVGTCDYDGDGISDILMRNPWGREFRVVLNPLERTPGTDVSGLWRFHKSVEAVASADFDGNGTCDLALLEANGDLWMVPMAGASAGTALPLGNVAEGWRFIGVGNEASPLD